jgi:thiol-disulfide isomerase/thioredoxin
MRKYLTQAVIFLASGLFLLILFGIYNNLNRISRTEKNIRSLPQFTFYTLDKVPYSSDEIKKGPVLITYYHPECEHCRYEIKGILDNLEDITNARILLISFAERDSILAFFRNDMKRMGNKIILLSDDSLNFKNFFSTSVIPSTFIYDKSLQLKKMYKGEVKPEAIIKLLNEND